MSFSAETEALFVALRGAAPPEAAGAIEALVATEEDRELARVNPLDFAAKRGLGEEAVIGAFLHAARLGLFELSWNVLCPSCGGVLHAGASLKSVNSPEYHCAFCAASYEPTLDELVEVSFGVNARVRRIAAHDPSTLSLRDYLRQVFLSSGVDLPDDAEVDRKLEEIVLEAVELPPGGTAIVSLPLPEGEVYVADLVTHSFQLIKVTGEKTRERQAISIVLDKENVQHPPLELRPGPVRISFDNRGETRTLPGVWFAGQALHDLLEKRRPFLTAKRLLTNQTFRDIYRTDTLDVDQRLKITSLTFLFTDLKGSTELYERVGDLVAYDLVRAHFRLLHEIVASEAGAVVKTIGDAVMATFPTPLRAVAAALRMRDALRDLNRDMLLKIGIHEGPCLAVMLNDRQDYFGQTVNIASRVQHLAMSRSIFATDQVVSSGDTALLLERSGIAARPQQHLLPGLANQLTVYEIP
jgi:class 3 adenylate cyclase